MQGESLIERMKTQVLYRGELLFILEFICEQLPVLNNWTPLQEALSVQKGLLAQEKSDNSIICFACQYWL